MVRVRVRLSALTRSLYIFSRSWCEVVRKSAYSFCSAAILRLLSETEPPPLARRSRMCACSSSTSLLRSWLGLGLGLALG